MPGSGARTAATTNAEMLANARATAARFERLYFTGRFVESWELLAPAAKRQVSKSLWTRVHEGCPLDQGATAGVVSSITIFGDSAIISVTRGTQASHGIDHYLLSYVGRQWSYAPDDMSIYHRGSVAADLQAAREAGFCGSWKVF